MQCLYFLNKLSSQKLQFDFVPDKPKILSSPSDVTKVEGASTTLTCHYEGKPIPHVYWYRNGTKLDVQSDRRLTVLQSGTVSRAQSSLTINNINRTDEAGTNVKSTMVLVCLQSRMRQTWLLTVSTGLMARISFCDQTKNESKAFQMFPFLSFCISESLDCFTFSPSSKNTSNKPYMNWLYLPDNISHHILFPDPPFIFVPPTNTATNETNTVTLLCVLEGKPQPVVTWEKYGVPLSIDGVRISTAHPWVYGRTTAKLTIKNTKRTDEGMYTCLAHNGIGQNKNISSGLFDS